MRFFQKLTDNINVHPLAFALYRKPHLWNRKKVRTTFENTPHSQVDDIWIRFSDDSLVADKTDTSKVMGDPNSIFHPAYFELPEVVPLIVDLMRATRAHAVDRVIITRLKPGCRILPHTDDQGSYVNDPTRGRFHIVIQGLPGSLYRTGEETVCMVTGEAWAFNALVEHEVQNNSADDRIHMLVDLRMFP